jgi:hypothetical protein
MPAYPFVLLFLIYTLKAIHSDFNNEQKRPGVLGLLVFEAEIVVWPNGCQETHSERGMIFIWTCFTFKIAYQQRVRTNHYFSFLFFRSDWNALISELLFE